jgi:hypothetical protein
MNVVGKDFSAHTPRLSTGRAIYLTRSLIHNERAGGVCVRACMRARALQQLDLSVGPQNYALHKPFTQATGKPHSGYKPFQTLNQ